MSADPVDVARQWLADTLASVVVPGCCGCRDCRDAHAAAILQAPGVQVGERLWQQRGGWRMPASRDEGATHSQVVIRLPTQPIEETP